MAELVGVQSLPAPWQGDSLVPVLKGNPQRKSTFSEHTHHIPQWSIRTDKMKLIRIEGSEAPQLFNLDDDPTEQRDLAGTGLPAEANLGRILEAWLKMNQDLSSGLLNDAAVLQESLKEQLKSLGYLDG